MPDRSLCSLLKRLKGGRKSPRSKADDFARSRDAALSTVTPKGELEKLFYAHEGRIALKWHHYLEIYERHFEQFRHRAAPVRLLELGIGRGGSLQIWREYFGPAARIVGIDIDPACLRRVEGDTAAIIGDQCDPATLDAALDKLGGGVDIVIDDGSHLAAHQVASFQYLYPRLSEDGVYLCEDLHAAYWPEFDGGYRREGTFIEHAKTLIDQLHAWYLDGELNERFAEFASSTYGIFIHRDVIAIEKRRIERPFHVQFGRGQL